MAASQYLASLLVQQDLTAAEVNALRSLRDTIQSQLSTLEGSPRFYYAGSFGKNTMIRQRYDLDIAMYWPSTVSYSIKGIYHAVGEVLKKNWQYVNSKTVSWEVPFQGGFHIDVVPGRAIDATFKEVNLHRRDTGSTLKTSLKTHIDFVRDSGRRDAIRLLKLWREKKKVPFKKSFLLEVMTIQGSSGTRFDNLEAQVQSALVHIRDCILTCSVADPANGNNSLSEDLGSTERFQIRQAAANAAAAKNWGEVFSG